MIFHHIREKLKENTYLKETNDEIKTMGYTFSSVSDIDVGESCFYFRAK